MTNTFRYLRDWLFGITQTEARERLKKAMEGATGPRVIYAEPDRKVSVLYVFRVLRSVSRRSA